MLGLHASPSVPAVEKALEQQPAKVSAQQSVVVNDDDARSQPCLLATAVACLHRICCGSYGEALKLA